MNYSKIFKPINVTIPSYWLVQKNHIFEIDVKEFKSLQEDDRDWVEAFYICPCVFYAKGYLPDADTKKSSIEMVVDIGVKWESEDKLQLIYDINIWGYIQYQRKSKRIFTEEFVAQSPQKALEIASKWMRDFSNRTIDLEGFS